MVTGSHYHIRLGYPQPLFTPIPPLAITAIRFYLLQVAMLWLLIASCFSSGWWIYSKILSWQGIPTSLKLCYPFGIHASHWKGQGFESRPLLSWLSYFHVFLISSSHIQLFLSIVFSTHFRVTDYPALPRLQNHRYVNQIKQKNITSYLSKNYNTKKINLFSFCSFIPYISTSYSSSLQNICTPSGSRFVLLIHSKIWSWGLLQ